MNNTPFNPQQLSAVCLSFFLLRKQGGRNDSEQEL